MSDGDTADLDAFGEFGVTVHVIKKNQREQIRIGVDEYRGREYINIRTFFDTGAGYRPTRRGVTIPTGMYPELLRGILELGVTLEAIVPETLSEVLSE